jgi:hypothetical protein
MNRVPGIPIVGWCAGIRETLERARLDAAKPETCLANHDAHREGAAGQMLTIPTMTRVYQLVIS